MKRRTFLQGAAKLQGGLAVTSAGGLRHGEQLVGDLGHGTDHHDRLLAKPAFYDGCSSLDRFRILHRGATEFHDDHRRTFLGLVLPPAQESSSIPLAVACIPRDILAPSEAPH